MWNPQVAFFEQARNVSFVGGPPPEGMGEAQIPSAHSCFVYGDSFDYRHRLSEFFAAGLSDGLRILYAGPGDTDALRADLSAMPQLDELISAGRLRIAPFGDIYGSGGPVDPEHVLARYATATEEALADGYRGLRVSADVTEVVRTPEQQTAFARYEFSVGQYMSTHPLSAMCSYHRDLGQDTLTQFAVLHAEASPVPPPFQIAGAEDGAIALRGDFDAYGTTDFARVLQRLQPQPQPTNDAVVVDMGAVRFVDHRLLLTLSSYASANSISVELRAAPSMVERLLDLLPQGHLRLAAAGAPR